ncbi:hypothetical protein [Marilutibacter alkalisoli]|uniref:Uncharacterized protein n=1 Tax=Marilutibacter alkalisoli TaxID=2591633 RepID=A0A514BTZ5_9GAMM|nr:hypothetical protein [Lysobacter alkalisoli]QDH70850.1 hypothetical protein FKV23_12725 [Lysobacter alkalisoli]
MRDPLRPYIYLVGLAISATLVLGGFVTGCRHGKASNAVAAARSAEAAGRAQASVNVMRTTLQEISRRAAEARAAASDWKRKAEQAADHARVAARKHEQTLAEIERELERAKRDPDCRAQLEEQLCVALH